MSEPGIHILFLQILSFLDVALVKISNIEIQHLYITACHLVGQCDLYLDFRFMLILLYVYLDLAPVHSPARSLVDQWHLSCTETLSPHLLLR